MESFNFGDPQNGKYLKFDADSRNPGKGSFGSWLLSTCMAAAAVSLQVNHLHFFFSLSIVYVFAVSARRSVESNLKLPLLKETDPCLLCPVMLEVRVC